jgi:hypothetical protein
MLVEPSLRCAPTQVLGIAEHFWGDFYFKPAAIRDCLLLSLHLWDNEFPLYETVQYKKSVAPLSAHTQRDPNART